MAVETAVDLVLQACEAIAEAHALGIVHRDLKPSNLFCLRRTSGQLYVKVLDFGISKVTTPGEAGHDVTRTQAVVGSPNYMSPEQLQSSKGVDARTDLWSLGIVLHELLTRELPFDADTVTELVIKIATSPAPPIRSLRPDVPAGLEGIIATCLRKEREERFASVLDLAIQLQPFGSAGAAWSVERIRGILGPLPSSAIPPHQDPSVARAQAEPPRVGPAGTVAAWAARESVRAPRRAGWMGAVFALGLIAVGAFVVLAETHKSSPASAAAVAARRASPSAPAAPQPSDTSVPPIASVTLPEIVAPPLATAPASSASQPRPLASPRPHPTVAASKPAGCDPPYTVDDQGRKHFKIECYK
jgi:serine/threonine-protein kinase